MAYYYFDSLMRTLKDMGVADILLPFLLIFTLVFSVLEKTKILGYRQMNKDAIKKPKTNLNTVVSLVMGLGVVIPHATNSYPPGRDVVEIINGALPGIAMLLVAIFSFILLLGMWSGKQPRFMRSNGIAGFVVIIMALAVIAIFVDSANVYRLPYWLWFLHDPATQAGIVVIVVFALLIWFITRDSEKDSNEGSESTLFRRMFYTDKEAEE